MKLAALAGSREALASLVSGVGSREGQGFELLATGLSFRIHRESARREGESTGEQIVENTPTPHSLERSDMKPIVVKVGGGAMAGGALEDLPRILASGISVALVHGGGQNLTRMLDALGIPTRFNEGLRVTDERTLEVAEMVFAGQVNKALVRELTALGVPAVGISGTDGPTFIVEPIPELGRVGKVTRVETKLVETLWGGGFVPAIAPLGVGPEGSYNVNADMASAALAVELGAGHLFLMTDVNGLLKGGETVAALTPEECEEYAKNGLAVGGMIPKLRTAAEAARGGVKARIINGNEKGTLAAALAGGEIGTLVSEGVVA